MFGCLNNFTGVKIIASPAMQRATRKPVKLHKEHVKRKPYHARIQKKWDKRYGVREELLFVSTMGALFTHPDNIQILRDSLGQ